MKLGGLQKRSGRFGEEKISLHVSVCWILLHSGWTTNIFTYKHLQLMTVIWLTASTYWLFVYVRKTVIWLTASTYWLFVYVRKTVKAITLVRDRNCIKSFGGQVWGAPLELLGVDGRILKMDLRTAAKGMHHFNITLSSMLRSSKWSLYLWFSEQNLSAPLFSPIRATHPANIIFVISSSEYLVSTDHEGYWQRR
jgi:hypothetical protein